MRFRAKVKDLEAIKYDGTNKDKIEKLIGRELEVVKASYSTGVYREFLCLSGRFINIGDWVGVEDGKIKILGAAELENDYTPLLTKEII